MLNLRLGHSVRDNRTGQVGTFHGWITHLGRLRAMVMIGGRLVYPADYEVTKLLHPESVAKKRRARRAAG